jgi:molybdopterin converting factor small subunit
MRWIDWKVMATIWIPALLRDLTDGQEQVTTSAGSVREAVDLLDAQYPGIKARLCNGDQLRAGITVVVDGEVSHLRLRHRLNEDSELHFLPAISGG